MHVSTERRSNTELAISTNKSGGVSVDYEIRVPRDSRDRASGRHSANGVVTSEFPGDVHGRRYLLGERFASSTAAHRVYLRVGVGGITIKSVPEEAEPPVKADAQ